MKCSPLPGEPHVPASLSPMPCQLLPKAGMAVLLPSSSSSQEQSTGKVCARHACQNTNIDLLSSEEIPLQENRASDEGGGGDVFWNGGVVGPALLHAVWQTWGARVCVKQTQCQQNAKKYAKVCVQKLLKKFRKKPKSAKRPVYHCQKCKNKKSKCNVCHVMPKCFLL